MLSPAPSLPRNREQLLADAEALSKEREATLHNSAQAAAAGLHEQAASLARSAEWYQQLASDWQTQAETQGAVP